MCTRMCTHWHLLWRVLVQVEEEVDTRWVQYLRDSCYAQMQEKKTLINKYACSLS
jgi:hypothetical protein